MPRKNGVHVPNAVTEQIVATIAAFPRDIFSLKEVSASLPGVRYNSVARTLALKARSGWLERCGHGRYRIGGVRIKTQLPAGLVSEAIWAVLFTDAERRFKRRLEIAAEAEQYIGRANVTLRQNVSSILSLWHKHGHLERTGERREYAYRLASHITERQVYS